MGCNLCWLVCPVEECITMETVETGRVKETWAERVRARIVNACRQDCRHGSLRGCSTGNGEQGDGSAMNTLIRNGTVVTARETTKTDVLLEGEIIKEVRAGIAEAAAEKVIDAAGMYVIPGGIDVHTHLDMPFGGTTSADDFETGTRAAAFGGTTSIVDFAIQARGTRMRDALDTWWKKAEGRACIDYGLHMIVTDLGASGLEDMDDLVNEGVASFKLFMAYPNVLMVDDATIFKALSQTARNGALICMHAENGSVIDVIIARALAEGKTAPIYHALTRPPRAEAEAVHRAIALAEIAGAPVYIVHLSSEDALNQVREARDRGVPAFAETCPQYLLLSIEELERPNFEGAKYVFTPPLRTETPSSETVGRVEGRPFAGGLDGPLSVLFRRPEDSGKRRFHEDSQRRAGNREPAAVDVSPRRECRKAFAESVCGIDFDHAGAHFRDVSQEGRNCPGQRRRPGDLGPGRDVHHQLQDASHARGLLDVRRLSGAGQCAHRDFARRSDCGWRRVSRQAGARQLSEAYGARWGVEVVEQYDPSLYDPLCTTHLCTTRTWRRFRRRNGLGGCTTTRRLWVAMSVCIPTYMLASGLIAGGMSWWQAIGTILLGNLIVLIPMLLNAHAGAKYGIPFPVFVRASFGVRGANLPAVLRALVACGWFGIQTWIGGQAIYSMLKILWPGAAASRRRDVDLLLRILGVEHCRDLARHRNHQGSGGHRRAVHAGDRPAAAVVDYAEGRRIRAGVERAQQVSQHRGVRAIFHSVADRDGGVLGHGGAEYSRISRATPNRRRRRCGGRRWDCRWP